MQIKVHKKFLQELASLPDKDKQKVEQFVFEQSNTFKSLHETPMPKIFDTQGNDCGHWAVRYIPSIGRTWPATNLPKGHP
jgi:mRNA-degrading endonuclease RelE of RelBE toxin-antitoxin system